MRASACVPMIAVVRAALCWSSAGVVERRTGHSECGGRWWCGSAERALVVERKVVQRGVEVRIIERASPIGTSAAGISPSIVKSDFSSFVLLTPFTGYPITHRSPVPSQWANSSAGVHRLRRIHLLKTWPQRSKWALHRVRLSRTCISFPHPSSITCNLYKHLSFCK